MATGYPKTVKLFLEGSDASVTITGAKANSVHSRLDNDGRLIHITDSSDPKKELYYNLVTNGGKAVLLAEVTIGAEQKGAKDCEEALAQPAQEPDTGVYTAPVLNKATPASVKVAELTAGKTLIIEGEHLANAKILVNKENSTSTGKLEDVTKQVTELSNGRVKVVVKGANFTAGAPTASQKFYVFAKNGSKYSNSLTISVAA